MSACDLAATEAVPHETCASVLALSRKRTEF